MLVICGCQRFFDPELQSDVCPHALSKAATTPLKGEDGTMFDLAAQIRHGRRLVGKLVHASFARQQIVAVLSVNAAGWVTVSGLRGEFQPHWFTECL